MRYRLTAMIQSRNESLSTSSQATREGVRARPSVACHCLAWKCTGAPAVLLSTPGLRRGMEGCGKGISHGSCMRGTKPTPCHSGSAERVTHQELHGHNPWCHSIAVANRERILGPIHSTLGRLLLRFPLWGCGGVSPLTTQRAAWSGSWCWMSLWKSLSLSSEEESLLVTFDPEVEIAPLGKSPTLSVSLYLHQES